MTFHHGFLYGCLGCLALSAGLAWGAEAVPPLRVATVYSSWNGGEASFEHEWDSILEALGCSHDAYENTELAVLAGKLSSYDLVLTCSVFNLEHTQDMTPLRAAFLAFLERGGLLLVTDASYDSTLAQGIGVLSASLALGSETASAHLQPSEGTRRITFGPDPALAQAPHDLAALGEAAGHWAHMLPTSPSWHEALRDADGKPVLVWQSVGKGVVAATSYFAFQRTQGALLGRALLENLQLLAAGARSGALIRELEWGELDPGINHGRLTMHNLLDEEVPLSLSVTVRGGASPPEPETVLLRLPPGGIASTEWTYVIAGRGPHEVRLEAVAQGRDTPVFVLSRRRDVPEVLRLHSWRRHVYQSDDGIRVRVDFLPDRPFDAAAHALLLQATVGATTGKAVQAAACSQDILVPTAGLELGAGVIRARLVRGDTEVAVRDMAVTVAPSPTVRLLPDRSCMVDGKPFFPMGMYIVSWKLEGTDPILAMMRDIAAGGFNVVHVGVRSADEFQRVLDEALRLSIMIIPEGGVPIEQAETFRDHPALLAWNPGDEPDGQGTAPESMAEIVGRIRDKDMSRPTYMTLCVPGSYGRYAQVADILAPDPYPVPNTPIGYVAESIERLQAVVEQRKPIWAIPQAFGGYGGWPRVPTPEEERNMTYQCLVHGVRGLIFYTYWDGLFVMSDHPDLWGMMKRLAGEVEELSPMLLSGTGELLVKLGDKEQVHVLRKTVDGIVWVIAVNTTRDDLDAFVVDLPGMADGKMTGCFGEAPLAVRGGEASLAMPALAVRVYRRVAGNEP